MNPRSITYHRESRILELDYSDDTAAKLPAELLRVFSPSAEVRGHSEEERVLQTGKKYIEIKSLESIGNYAIRIIFDDGHDTGIYSWSFLHDLVKRQDEYWQDYLTDLNVANASRLPTVPIGHWTPPRDDEPS